MIQNADNYSFTYMDYRNIKNFLSQTNTFGTKRELDKFKYFRLNLSKDPIDRDQYLHKFFRGRCISLPTFRIGERSFNKFSDFEKFTSCDEVNNISLWALECLNFLSFFNKVRLGKELEIEIQNNPRNGRLDVVGLSDDLLLVLEAKVDLTKLLSENRYLQQIPNYLAECDELIDKYNKNNSSNVRTFVVLLVGGKETDMYPPGHIDCTTGMVGNIAKNFYLSIEKNNIKFISANALWALAECANINNNLPWFGLIRKIFSDENNVGFLTGGLVRKVNDGFQIENIFN